MYVLTITDARWWCYDIFGNIGWIAYFIGLALSLVNHPAYMQHKGVFTFVLLGGLACAGIILIGLVELVSERVKGLSRVLSKARLYRGFGAIACGSLAAAIVSVVALVLVLKTEPSIDLGILHLGLMGGGAILCFIFVSLLFKGFVKQDG